MKLQRLVILSTIAILFLFPLASANQTVQINHENDDASEYGDGDFRLNDSGLRVRSTTDGISSEFYRCSGFRFENVQVPQGAIIGNAYLELFFRARDDMNGIIYAQDNNNTQSFGINQAIIDNTLRPKTTAHLVWKENDVGESAWSDSDNIANMIQEVTDRENWEPGNSITIFIIADTDDNIRCSITAYDDDPVEAAKLHVIWGLGVGETSYPTIASPRSAIYIMQYLQSNGGTADNISAKISFESITCNFVFMEDYPENDNTIENCDLANSVVSGWFVGTPEIENTYTFNIEWGFMYDNEFHTTLSENFEIQIAYFDVPSEVVTELERDFIILFLIAFNFIMIVIVRIPYLQIFVGLISAVIAGLLNGTTAFPWINILLIVTAIYSIINTYKTVKVKK